GYNKMASWTYEKKLLLSEAIGKIKTTSVLEKIYDIILNDTNPPNVTKNNNGYFMIFDRLSDDTYDDIEKVVYKELQDNKELLPDYTPYC
ncbi:MAG: hypothetical protein WBA35_12885, partial [Litorimonas sp.]